MRQSYEKFRFSFGEAVTRIYSDRLSVCPVCKLSDLYSGAKISKSQFSSWRSGVTVPSFSAALAFFDSCGYEIKLVRKDEI